MGPPRFPYPNVQVIESLVRFVVSIRAEIV